MEANLSTFDRYFAIILLTVMSVQIVPIEGYEISIVKVTMMGICLFVFLFRVPYLSKAVVYSLIYWSSCAFPAFFYTIFRFSTLGYAGLFLITFIAYYNLVYKGVFSLELFLKILKTLICVFAGILVLQQVCVLIGLRNVAFLNLVGADYYAWNRLPVLTCEPSHTAVILTGFFLGYLRCVEIKNRVKPSFSVLFNKEHRVVTFAYLWLTFTMGSGTGWFGFSIICLYFVNMRSFYYVLPIFMTLYIILQQSDNVQFRRALSAAQATVTADINKVQEVEGSASTRIIPVINTFKDIDLSKKESWIGKGTISIEERDSAWKNSARKISVIEQYGLLAFLTSLFLLFSCMIKKIISLETLCFVILLMMSLSNAYMTWSMLFVFTTIRYFKDNKNCHIN